MTVAQNKTHPLKRRYEEARRTAQKTLGLKNPMETPRITKIVLNAGLKEAVSNSKVITTAMNIFEAISGQKPVKTLAKKSIAGFKIREGMPIGVRVTLRGTRMHAFLGKLIDLSLPKVRDFQGVPTKFDGKGNYNLGIKEWSIFPETESTGSNEETAYGMNITIAISANNDAHARALLDAMGMPFRKK